MTDRFSQIERLLAEKGPTATAKTLGISRQRLQQILQKKQRNVALPKWIQGLDIQTAQALLANGYTCKSDVSRALECSEYIKRIGPKREAILRQWLSLAS